MDSIAYSMAPELKGLCYISSLKNTISKRTCGKWSEISVRKALGKLQNAKCFDFETSTSVWA